MFLLTLLTCLTQGFYIFIPLFLLLLMSHLKDKKAEKDEKSTKEEILNKYK